MAPAAALKRALALAPGSLRAVAREAGVSHAILVMITEGERPATARVLGAVAAALERWGERCARAAAGLRQAQPRRQHHERRTTQFR